MKFLFRLLFFLFLFPAGCVCAQNDSLLLKFGIFADAQYGDCETNGTRFYRKSLLKLDSCVNDFNKNNVDFTINLGDMIDRDFNDIDTLLSCLDNLEGPIYHITGNHDYKNLKGNGFLYEKLDMPGEYYSFERNGWVFVMLNTNEISVYANGNDSVKKHELDGMLDSIKRNKGKQAHGWNGGVGASQLAWLDGLLSDCSKERKNVLVFTHHPLYPSSEFTALNNIDVLDVLSKYHSCVKAVFSGHHHAGSFGMYKGIPMVTLEGMVETRDSNAYAVVKILNDKIFIEGRGRVASRMLDY